VLLAAPPSAGAGCVAVGRATRGIACTWSWWSQLRQVTRWAYSGAWRLAVAGKNVSSYLTTTSLPSMARHAAKCLNRCVSTAGARPLPSS